ncbi:hypothetical protein B0J13DRAFT_236976 [Dactylonectria estremocensis]|uniref:DUF676 domain-containing protein n=1 Tax=Dactylonectria estremocensis TaxID=1079267 RepID=A0A9P9D9Q3_9HYPO|nr:hypothetical protein B0J13DRAFT_236976 [Dactylonectria estremocensis]
MALATVNKSSTHRCEGRHKKASTSEQSDNRRRKSANCWRGGANSPGFSADHGFRVSQGGEATFGDDYQFTKHLRDLVAQALPKLDVRVLVYPKYETRGDLGECVSRFRDRLQDKVIDMEVAAGTPSPTIEPSVRAILIGHSMGGIVAAEMLIGLASEKPVYSEDGIQKPDSPSFNALMFPYI